MSDSLAGDAVAESATRLTVTGDESPGSIPPDPATDCSALLVELPLAGEVMVTTGGVVSMVKVTDSLNACSRPSSVSSSCATCAVYVPSARCSAVVSQVPFTDNATLGF